MYSIKYIKDIGEGKVARFSDTHQWWKNYIDYVTDCIPESGKYHGAEDHVWSEYLESLEESYGFKFDDQSHSLVFESEEMAALFLLKWS